MTMACDHAPMAPVISDTRVATPHAGLEMQAIGAKTIIAAGIIPNGSCWRVQDVVDRHADPLEQRTRKCSTIQSMAWVTQLSRDPGSYPVVHDIELFRLQRGGRCAVSQHHRPVAQRGCKRHPRRQQPARRCRLTGRCPRVGLIGLDSPPRDLKPGATSFCDDANILLLHPLPAGAWA